MGGWLASDGDDIATPAGGRGGRGISDIFPGRAGDDDGNDSKRDRGRAGDTTGAGCCRQQATGKHRDTLAPPHGPFHCPIDNSVPEISILSLRLPRTASRGVYILFMIFIVFSAQPFMPVGHAPPSTPNGLNPWTLNHLLRYKITTFVIIR